MGLAAVLAIGVLSARPAWAQPEAPSRALAELNARVTEASATRAAPIDRLLWALIGTTPPPGEFAPADVGSIERVRLMELAEPAWPELSAWAEEPPQLAALAALNAAAGSGPDGPVFAQPYGPAGVPDDVIAAGASTDLGRPPLLAAAEFGALRLFARLELLANIDIARLRAAEDPGAAIDRAAELVELGRVLAGRPMGAEVRVGLALMARSLERMRDVVYLDYRGPQRLGRAELRNMVMRLEPTADRLWLDGIVFPAGDRAAADELAELVFTPGGRLDAEGFGMVMTRLAIGRRPLRLFAAAADWRGAAEGGLGRSVFEDEVERVFSGWTTRWPLPPYDPALAVPFYYTQLDTERYPLLAIGLSDLSDLFEQRLRVRTELAGTRTAMAVVGYNYHLGGLVPQLLTAVRPQWIVTLPEDPLDVPPRLATEQPPIKYLVTAGGPARTGGAGSLGRTLSVTPPAGERFEAEVEPGEFILYSVGGDHDNDFVRGVSNDPGRPTGDYLLFPPMLSLVREHGG